MPKVNCIIGSAHYPRKHKTMIQSLEHVVNEQQKIIRDKQREIDELERNYEYLRLKLKRVVNEVFQILKQLDNCSEHLSSDESESEDEE